ncbi:hypothetical protein [Shewanella sp.]|uniref:hypothetical protein n=1 Tax=Shewanella sp. TaxID=50422 RepID=UPI003F2BBE82
MPPLNADLSANVPPMDEPRARKPTAQKARMLSLQSCHLEDLAIVMIGAAKA